MHTYTVYMYTIYVYILLHNYPNKKTCTTSHCSGGTSIPPVAEPVHHLLDVVPGGLRFHHVSCG